MRLKNPLLQLNQEAVKRFRVPGYGTGQQILEPVPRNRFLRQITTSEAAHG